MRKFSWYTIPVKLTDLSTVYQYAVDRFIPLEVDRHGFGSYIHVKAGTFVTGARWRLAALQAQYERRPHAQPSQECRQAYWRPKMNPAGMAAAVLVAPGHPAGPGGIHLISHAVNSPIYSRKNGALKRRFVLFM